MQVGDMMSTLGPAMGLLMVLFWLILLGLAAIGVVAIVSVVSKGNGRRSRKPGDDALAVARERLARGEIDSQELSEIREALAENS